VYVIREAFDDADDALLEQAGWIVSRIAFIGGDISSYWLSQDNPSTEAIYRHCGPLYQLFEWSRLGS
jgi:hypothetical protein